MRTRSTVLLALGLLASVLVAVPASAQGTTHFGVTFPEGDRSFADLAEWEVRPQGQGNEASDPSLAEGPPDCDGDSPCFASLGREAETGLLVLTFVDNALTADGTGGDDIYFFEAGSQVGGVAEEFAAEISVDGSDWLAIGEIAGGEGTGVDIDPVADPAAEYRHVRVASTSSRTGPPTPGPDIDAVGAISSVPADPPAANGPGDGTAPVTLPEPAATVGSGTVLDLTGSWRDADGSRILLMPENDQFVGRVVEPSPRLTACGVQSGDQLWLLTPGDPSAGSAGAGTAVVISYGADCARSSGQGEYSVAGESLNICGGESCSEADAVAGRVGIVGAGTQRDARLALHALLSHTLRVFGGGSPRTGVFAGDQERVLYVATDANFADALTVAGITGVNRGFFLQISSTDGDANAEDIARVRPDRLVVIGGQQALPDEVLPSESEVPRDRIGGQNRFDTAALISQSTFSSADVVYVATGNDFPDALAAGAQASLLGSPILLVGRDIPAETRAELQRLSPDRILVMGGPAVVGEGVMSALGQFAADVSRVAGGSRVDTAVEVSRVGYPQLTPKVAYVVNGRDDNAALAVAGNAWVLGGPMLLTEPTLFSSAAGTELQRLNPDRVILVADASELDTDVVTALEDTLGG